MKFNCNLFSLICAKCQENITLKSEKKREGGGVDDQAQMMTRTQKRASQ